MQEAVEYVREVVEEDGPMIVWWALVKLVSNPEKSRQGFAYSG